MSTPPPLPATAAATTANQPWPVSLLADKIATYVSRMSPVWIEGQIVQLNRRPGARVAFLTLRDTKEEISLPLKIFTGRLGDDITDGKTVVAHVKPEFWTKNGSLTMHAAEIRVLGLGDLLARIAELGKKLAAEGLFDESRKKDLPFLPRTVGLICGREAKAYDDVVNNARLRWPAVKFNVHQVAVQGKTAVAEVTSAMADLDADPDVDVIVVARGGGAVEDLLPFSDEGLIRAAARTFTPLVSAIGHETDSPLLDHVADYRASTPTDAARRIVPDVDEEFRALGQATQGLRSAITLKLNREADRLQALTSRPVLASPHRMLLPFEAELRGLVETLRATTTATVSARTADISALTAQLRALSPLDTLQRGYAVVRADNGHVVRAPDDVVADQDLDITVAGGQIPVTVRNRRQDRPAVGD